jgi:hypothetical protein
VKEIQFFFLQKSKKVKKKVEPDGGAEAGVAGDA